MKRHRQGGFLIAKIHLLGGRIFDRLLRRESLELNPAQGRILFPLWQDGPMSMRELARKASLGPSTLTSMLERLVRAGYVARRRSARDRRKIVVALAIKDHDVFEVWERVSAEMARLYYRGFEAGRIDRFERDLESVLLNLVDAERKAGRGWASGGAQPG
jgi:DNA-binding MarR family transcriptional regulator